MFEEHYRNSLYTPEGDFAYVKLGDLVRTMYSTRIGLVVEEIDERGVKVLWPDSAPNGWNPCTEIKIAGKIEFISVNFTVKKCGT